RGNLPRARRPPAASRGRVMRTPAAALVWEAWRLTRTRFMVATGIATIGGGAILAATGDKASEAAVAILFLVPVVAIVTVLDLPLAKLGFPFTAGFARPVSTRVLVLVPMLYLAALGAAVCLIPMAVLRILFDVPFPLAAIPAWIGAAVLTQTAASWWASA